MRRLALVLSMVLFISSCGGQQPSLGESPATTAPSGTIEGGHDQGTTFAVDQTSIGTPLEENVYEGFDGETASNHTLVAIALGELEVFEAPDSPVPIRTLPATTILGTATVVTALGQPTDGRLEVLVPGRPNGGTGWVDTGRVDLYMVTDRVVIDLSERQLTYYQDGIRHLSTTVAIGTSHNPTPTGFFFVTDLVDIPGGGPWGPAALGLSARSETITEFNGGDGIIGIHGTNKPGSIGKAASLGCVRLPNDVILELRSLVSLGTPVEIRA